jgi:hypothetical protein
MEEITIDSRSVTRIQEDAPEEAISEAAWWWQTEAADSCACRRNEVAAQSCNLFRAKEWNTKNTS